MNEEISQIRNTLKNRIHSLIDELSDGSQNNKKRDELLSEISDFQKNYISQYQRVWTATKTSFSTLWPPAIPTDVFRVERFSIHAPEQDIRIFYTSGTTNSMRGSHPLCDLSLYDHAARVGGKRMLFPDVEKMRFLALVPHANDLLDSSLSYMISQFAQWFGVSPVFAIKDNQLDENILVHAIEESIEAKEPIAILGTSFAFVHADDALGKKRFKLPDGSRIMQTGGFKGRSRTMDASAMQHMLQTRYGVREEFIIAEYGMTELSSQMWENTLYNAVSGYKKSRYLWVPGWVRATPLHPQTMKPMMNQDVGLLRIDDLANLDTVAAIQTADLARQEEDGIILMGRATDATPRGCSIGTDLMLQHLL